MGIGSGTAAVFGTSTGTTVGSGTDDASWPDKTYTGRQAGPLNVRFTAIGSDFTGGSVTLAAQYSYGRRNGDTY